MTQLLAVDSYLVTRERAGYLEFYGIDDDQPRHLGSVEIPYLILDIETAQGFAYVLTETDLLYIVDLDSDEAPRLVADIGLPAIPSGLACGRGFLYVTMGDAGLATYDIADPRHPHLLEVTPFKGRLLGVAVLDGDIICANKEFGLQILSGPESRHHGLVSTTTCPSPIGGVDVFDDHVVARSFSGSNVHFFKRSGFSIDYIQTSIVPQDSETVAEFDGSILVVSRNAVSAFTPESDGSLRRDILFMTGSKQCATVLGNDLIVSTLSSFEIFDTARVIAKDLPSSRLVPEISTQNRFFDHAMISASGYPYFVDLSDPESPATSPPLQLYDAYSRPQVISLLPDRIVVGPSLASLVCIDVSDVKNPRRIGATMYPQRMTSTISAGPFLYALNNDKSLVTVDCTDPTNPVVVDALDTYLSEAQMVIDDGSLYLIGLAGSVSRYGLSTPAHPEYMGIAGVHRHSAAVVDGDRIFTRYRETFSTYELNDSGRYDRTATLDTGTWVTALIHVDGLLYCYQANDYRLTIFDVHDATVPPRFVASYPVLGFTGSFGSIGCSLAYATVHGLVTMLPYLCREETTSCRWSDHPAFAQHTLTSCAIADIDRDGHTDIASLENGAPVLWFGGADTSFARTAPIVGIDSGSSILLFDYDNDGFQDLHVSRLEGDDALYRNEGDRTFAPTSGATPPNTAQSVAACAFDADRDGLLDLYVVNRNASNRLLRNIDGGSFIDAGSDLTGDSGEGRSAAVGDYDDDGDPDLYIVNRGANRLLRNEGDFHFSDVTTPELADSGEGKSACWGDADGDGDLDLYLVNQNGVNRYFRNTGGDLESVSVPALNDAGDGRDAAWIDVDNDGDLDLVLMNSSQHPKTLINDGMGNFADDECRFLDMAPASNGLAPLDADADGLVDFVLTTSYGTSHLVLNQTRPPPHWTSIELRGSDSNGDGVGSRVRLKSNGRWYMRELGNGSGHLSHAQMRLHFGLGATGRIDSLEVRWPGGRVQHLADLPRDMALTIHEDGAVPNLVSYRTVEHIAGDVVVRWRLDRDPGPFRYTVSRKEMDKGWYVPMHAAPEVQDDLWTWIDETALPGAAYSYRVSMVTSVGETVLFETRRITIPELRTRLLSNTPNPFNPETSIAFSVARPGTVCICVYDLSGRRIRNLVDGSMPVGIHEVVWDGRDDQGRSGSSNSYLVRMLTDEGASTIRICLLK